MYSVRGGWRAHIECAPTKRGTLSAGADSISARNGNRHTHYLYCCFCARLGAMMVMWTALPEHDTRKLEAENDAVIFQWYAPKQQYK